jgi:CubicO group peptidase (beta-lactamase class C family)
MQALLQTALERSLSMDGGLDMEAALAYARPHGLHALLVARGNTIVAREFASGFTADKPHPLYSGTKSFWGAAALRARADGLLQLDELVAETIQTWYDDPWKRRVTLRMLLSLTSGHGFGGLGASVPTYERALEMPLKKEPGSSFTYSGIPFQVFGAVLARKLAAKNLTPHEYLQSRILAPAHVGIANWRALADGTHPLPTGASLRADDWLHYGRFVLANRTSLAECFEGSAVNARYGLGWWLGARGAPSDLAYASGSAGQALYLVPSLNLIVVHFAKSNSYRHETFLRRLFTAR